MRRTVIVVSLVALVAALLGACGGNDELDTSTPTTRHGKFPAAVVSTTTPPSTTPFGAVVRTTTTTAKKPSTVTTTVNATTTTTAVRVKPAETPLPVARSGVAGVGWQGLVVVAGGAASGGGLSVRVDAFDPKTGQWSRGPNLPVAVRDAGLAVLGDDLWIVGGTAIENDQPVAQSKTYFFRPNGDGWEDGPALQTARAGAAVSVLGNFLVASGGEATDGTILDSVESLLKGGSSWRASPRPLPQPRSFASAFTLSGRIYVAGGRTPGAPAIDSVVSLGPGTSGWRNESHLDTERVASAGAGACVAGGQNNNGVVEPIECFGTGFWINEGQMRVPRYGLAAVVLDGWLHLIGGATAGSGATNVHEVVDVSAVPS